MLNAYSNIFTVSPASRAFRINTGSDSDRYTREFRSCITGTIAGTTTAITATATTITIAIASIAITATTVTVAITATIIAGTTTTITVAGAVNDIYAGNDK
jgi:Mg/Co/Ni transporter MgtE